MREQINFEGRPVEILLIEDSAADIGLVEEAFGEGRVLNRLSVVRDGVAAMDFLCRKPPYQDAPHPDLVLLDLRLPKKDGQEVIREMKADPNLRRIPVVILTTSSADEDVVRAYDSHVNSYITKPVELDKFLAVIERIEDFWLMIVKLPPE